MRDLDSPFWRSALTNVGRRCIVPVTRFCEWTAEPHPETRRKSKVWFGMHEDHEPLFAFAGLWRPGVGGPFMAFLTCEANQLVDAIHPKAMPVIPIATRSTRGWTMSGWMPAPWHALTPTSGCGY